MPAGTAVWGIDIGQCGLKAVRLRPGGEGQVELAAFDIIEHPRILSHSDADPEELIKAALEKFLSRNDWHGDKFVVGVPGQQTFARFCKLPPVDPKKIPDIVKFEASQQIPFDMDEVVWDYQVFTSADSPDVEVGIFAIKRELIRKHIGYFTEMNIAPIAVQTVPSALYNFCRFDLPAPEPGSALVILDIGAQNTDLVIAEANGAWSRNIPLGGNNFTDALVKAFKQSFAKAEAMKRTAATSRYARQVFQAMRPVFAELVAEIQRSIGFYSSTHRDVELKRVIGLGNAFRLPGLQKYLENNLSIAGGVSKVEKFNRLVPTATINAPQFTENVLSFGVAYGLALQGLGLAAISASLLPPELARVALWNRKRPYFAAAAACLALASSFVWARQFMDASALEANSDLRQQTQQIINEAQNFKKKFAEVQTNTGAKEEQIKRYLAVCKDKLLVPRILALVHEALPEVAPEIAAADTPEKLKQVIKSDPVRFARQNRREVLIESFNVDYVPDIVAFDVNTGAAGGAEMSGGGFVPGGGPVSEAGVRGMPRGVSMREAGPVMEFQQPQPAAAGGEAANPGFVVRLSGRMYFGGQVSDAISFLSTELLARIRQLGQREGLGFHVLIDDAENRCRLVATRYFDASGGVSAFLAPRDARAAAAGGTEEVPAEFQDPVTGEDTRNDWRFEIAFKIKLGDAPKQEGDRPKPPGGG